MKKIATIIILTTFSVLLSAQTKSDKIDKVIISYRGDSTLLTEKYEINVEKEMIYYITPIVNYLDIKGEKYRTRIKIKKQNWDEIIPLINSLDTLTLDQNEKEQDGKIIYSIEFSKDNKEIGKYQFYTEQVPNEVKRLFEIIRNYCC